MNDECYVCSLHAYSSEGYFGEQFDTFEEAKNKGIETIKDYNRNLNKSYYDSENEVFASELEDIVDCEDKLPRAKITHFYIAKLEECELPNDFGQSIVNRLVREDYHYSGGEIQLTDDERESDETIEEVLIKGLNKVIGDYLNERFKGCIFAKVAEIKKIIVE
ncbi:MAG: hypothetical protein SPI61_00420 [Ezakiella sp.]|uniref:hypothetical protein n=1 Tax=Ezakiella sp. TaxID=1935205 RepID=UPI002A91666E|nr:hypothetical protein [Ezakiella sp.]MDY6079193.1 hypothetical protein [Ezakiella sp.]